MCCGGKVVFGDRAGCKREVGVHHAVRLASSGSDSVVTLLRGVMATEWGGVNKGYLTAAGQASCRTRGDDTVLIATLACVAGALLARGRWESALRIIPPGVTHLPAAPSTRTAEGAAVQL
ncbi:putative TPR-repeat-containing chaperone protein DNAJ [Trypanosoma rangeli]|uniref:Putative TPR-repeat-containing chaperone protein DNAJ n=1 Tax=Trypanosoma rangeli TaxID=5698 RepID=A0A3S5ISA8_TRYRA|nr:putative TPR-repeat-containing chaperone protein DNAJ [Trypanosoma rangeli]RNF10469.1 putative TPR-repeat-containing chaperone protein DNAJ [Trypanosoma rangeli]|eukprot:RNF10469.1 putative TPR-repeat-containing chaperone protein DNAJ [Trypanosoma rangeli]